MEKVYRCGWCGNPTTESGECLTLEQVNTIKNADWDKAEQVHGQCCPHGNADHQNRFLSIFDV